jgi:Tfp pilus assembly PilM family ATPase
MFAIRDLQDNFLMRAPSGSARNRRKRLGMRKQKILSGTLRTVTRRYAAGVDVSEDAVRFAVVSRRLKANASVCIEHLECVALPEGAVVNGDFVDRAAIVAALREGFGQWSTNGAWRSLRCAMGLSAAVTHMMSVPLTQLIDVHDTQSASGGDPFGLLEPAVLAEAERATGIERAGLAVDWAIQTQDDGRTHVSIAAAARRHVEARVEAAAAAGIALSAIDGEPSAALRAMRQSGCAELGDEARYLACWLESAGLRGWLVDGGETENEVRYPAPEYRTMTEALRDLAGGHAPIDCIYLSGELALMSKAGLTVPALAQLFDCPVLPFEAAPNCNGAADIDGALRYSPRFAVAFGLALREVMQ